MPYAINVFDFSQSDARFSGDEFFSVMRSFVVNTSSAGKTINRIGFIDHLLEKGMLRPEEITAPIARQCMTAYAIAVVQEIRRDFCRTLQEQYGERFFLFGNNWHNVGLKSRPAETATAEWHQKAAISVDFGSLFIDSSLYTRSQAIIRWGGRLLQFEQVDAAAIFADHAEFVCFKTKDGMCKAIDAALRSPVEYDQRHRALADFLKERNDCERIFRPLGDDLMSISNA